MKVVVWLFVLVVLVIAGFLLFIYSGLYNVAATSPDPGFVQWIMSTTSDNSVRAHAKSVKVPDFSTEENAKEGFEHYHEMCVTCHGAPGVKPSEIGQGIYPPAPDLAESANEMSPAQLFWVIKNGIKMTAMPAFGPTHSDQKIWDIVAFVKRLPGMPAETYGAMVRNAGQKPEETTEKTETGSPNKPAETTPPATPPASQPGTQPATPPAGATNSQAQ